MENYIRSVVCKKANIVFCRLDYAIASGTAWNIVGHLCNDIASTVGSV